MCTLVMGSSNSPEKVRHVDWVQVPCCAFLERPSMLQRTFVRHPYLPFLLPSHDLFRVLVISLDGRNRAIVIAESLRESSPRFESLAFLGCHISPKNTEIGPRRPYVRCTAIQIARLAFVGVVFVPRGTAEWPARVDRVR